MDEHLSTEQVSWILERSPGTVRDMIRDGEIEGIRIPAGFRVSKAEAGRKLSDRQIERAIDKLIETNEHQRA